MSRQTPLRRLHDEREARFTTFGGWEMPVEFDSIREEHRAVRESAGIFDVSHMGQIRVTGPDATALMGRLTSNDVAALDVGDAQYAAITDADGTIIDDTVVYRLPDDGGPFPSEEDGPAYLFVPNAGGDEASHDRWVEHRDRWGLEATVDNRTEEYAMVAVQGPDAAALVAEAVDESAAVEGLGRFEATAASVAGVECWTARTGYTGEDGFEFVLPRDEAETVWSAFDCQPCGLGARDTLRIEAGYLLAGQEFDREGNRRTPYEAGIGFAVDLDTEFVGRDALERVAAEGVDERLVGFELTDRGVPRHGYDIADADGDVVGTVTSGTMSPTLSTPIGLGYVPDGYADPGTTLQVLVRGQGKRARVETLPFVETAR